jgi:tetratricopeptide (TPR) repeat protein
VKDTRKNAPGGVARLGRAVTKLAILWLVIALAGGIFSDAGVHASEGETSLQLEAPQVRTELPRARVIIGSDSGQLQIVRERGEKSQQMTVITGFPCDRDQATCALVKYGSFAEAATVFRYRIDSGEDGAQVRCALAHSLFLKGDLLGAARAYTWAATGYPQDPHVRNGLANVLTELKQFSMATEEFEALTGEPAYAAVAHNNLGNTYRKMDRPEEALKEYNLALVRDPGLVAARYNRAGALLSLGKYKEAAQAFREVTHRARHFPEAYLYEGLAHLKNQQSVLAASALYRAGELGLDTPVLHLALGMACQEQGMDNEAVFHLQRALAEDPQDEETYQLLSVSLVRVGNLKQAAKVLEQAFYIGPQDAESHFILGLKLFLCEQPANAARHFMMAAAKGRRGADTFFGLGQALFMSGDVDSAIRSLSLAARLNSSAPEVHFALGVALYHNSDLQSAIREMKTASALDPGDLDIQLVLMDLYRHAGDFTHCASAGRRIVADNPELVTPRFDTAYCLALTNDLDRAVETMEDALDHDVEGEEVLGVWKRLAAAAGSKGKGHLPGPHLLLAVIHERRGNWSEAVQAYERFILHSPSKDWIRKAMGRIHRLVPAEAATCPTCHDGL